MDKEKQEPTAIFSCLTRKNSIIQSIIVSITKIYSIYSAFCKQTSLHGLKHTVAANFYFFERLLWFVLTISAFAGAVYCALNQLARYNSEPVVVSLQRDYRSWSTAFPAVTVCFLERIQVEKAKSFISSKWNVTEESDPEKYQYYYEFVELIAEVSFRRNLQNFWKYQSDDSVNDIDLLQLALDVYPDYPLETVTSDHGEIKWIQVMTEEGLCKSFNSQYAQHQKIGDFPWRTLDLMKCHYHSEACHVRISSLENGVRYFIHSPFDIATAISNPTGEIFAGDELITDYKVVEIEAANSIEGLRPEQRRCKYPDEWLGNSIRAYSFGLCQMHCRTRLALMFCGCRPYFHVKGDGDVCDAHGMACIGRNVEILINLPKNLAKCPCMPQCEESNYYSHTKKIINQIMMSLRNTEKEVVIKAPWGNVAALTWGNSKNPPVLLGSGRQVPCTAYRALVFKLPQDFFYISFDFPGNGTSDHLPKGVRFTAFDLIPSLLLVADHFKCHKFQYIGHSLGSVVGKFFNMAYPGRMSRVVEIDPFPAYLSMQPGEVDEWYNETYANHYEDDVYRKHTNCDTAPTYSYDEVKKLLTKAQYINLNENKDFEKDRYVKKDENGLYRFSHDQRMKSTFRLPFSPDYLKQLYTLSKTPIFAIFADSTIGYRTFGRSAFALNENEWPNGNYKVKIIKGDHNSHIHEPECMAEDISKFLLEGVNSNN